jgi:hypothetical protein
MLLSVNFLRQWLTMYQDKRIVRSLQRFLLQQRSTKKEQSMNAIEQMAATAVATVATFVLTTDEQSVAAKALAAVGTASKMAREFGIVVFHRTDGKIHFWDSGSDAYKPFADAVSALAPKDHSNVRMVVKAARDAAKEAHDVRTKPELQAAKLKAEGAAEALGKARERVEALKAEQKATTDPVAKAKIGVLRAQLDGKVNDLKQKEREAHAAFTLAKAEANPVKVREIDWAGELAEAVGRVNQCMAHIPDGSFDRRMHKALHDLIATAVACEWIKVD